MELAELKKSYDELSKKYKLPAFNEINENFEIEKIDVNTETLLRVVRKIMMEKIVNSIGFLEMVMNPVNAPRFYLNYIRAVTAEDRNDLEKLYSSLGELSIISLDNEIDYSEKKEAELIKKIFQTWQLNKDGFRKILGVMKKPNGNLAKKEKSYFG